MRRNRPKTWSVPLGLTNDRSPGGIAAAINSTYGTTSFTAGQISATALNFCRRSFLTDNI